MLAYLSSLILQNSMKLYFRVLLSAGSLAFTSAAFAPKSAFKRQETSSLTQQQEAMAAAYCTEDSCYPPPLAFASDSSSEVTSSSPTKRNEQDLDEDFVIGYGTGVVACVMSLAVGFALGYSS